jgi:hypothetical protein
MSSTTRKILRELRSFVPNRGLTHTEALLVAEIQATRLRQLVKSTTPPVPVFEIAAQMGVLFEHDATITAPSSAEFDPQGLWRVRFRDREPELAQHAVAYQLKRIIDDQYGDTLYPPTEATPTVLRRHFAAEQFAICLTMPQALIEQAWHRGHHEPHKLAKLFQTSPEAMSFRLAALNLLFSSAGKISWNSVASLQQARPKTGTDGRDQAS